MSLFMLLDIKKGKELKPKLKYLLGKKLFQADLPELPELDNLFAPQAAIALALKI